MDKEKFDAAIWDLYMMETMLRSDSDPVQADRVKNIRVKLKESVASTGEQKPENKPNVDAQEFVGRVGCFIGILLWLASCNWFLSILENIKW